MKLYKLPKEIPKCVRFTEQQILSRLNAQIIGCIENDVHLFTIKHSVCNTLDEKYAHFVTISRNMLDININSVALARLLLVYHCTLPSIN